MIGLLKGSGPKKILVVCPIGLGNFIMATPSLNLLRQEVGHENLHLLALRMGIKQMAELSGYVSKIHYWDPDEQSKKEGLKALLAIRKERYDYCLLLFPSNNWRYCLYTLLSGAKVRIGFDYPNTTLPRRIQNYSLPLNVAAHDTDQNCDLIEALLGTDGQEHRQQTFPYAPSHPETEALQRENYYVVQPGSSVERGMIEKRLPPEMFGELAARIYRQFHLKCIILGGPEQEELKQLIIQMAPEAILRFESHNLNELAGLISHSRFYLGNDSGLMHISAALGKSCAIFYGPTDERRCGPYSNGLRFGEKGHDLIIRRSGLSCSPCWTAKTVGANPACVHGDKRCLTGFEIEECWGPIQKFIRETLSREQPLKQSIPVELPLL